MEAIASVHEAPPVFLIGRDPFRELLDSWGRDWTSSHNPVDHTLIFPSIRGIDQGCGFVSRVDMTHPLLEELFTLILWFRCGGMSSQASA